MIAAHRGGIDTIVIPQENEKDLKEIPAHVLRGLKIIPVEHMDEVLGAAVALDDVPGFLRAGNHVIDSIFEGAAAAGIGAPVAPAGVN